MSTLQKAIAFANTTLTERILPITAYAKLPTNLAVEITHHTTQLARAVSASQLGDSTKYDVRESAIGAIDAYGKSFDLGAPQIAAAIVLSFGALIWPSMESVYGWIGQQPDVTEADARRSIVQTTVGQLREVMVKFNDVVNNDDSTLPHPDLKDIPRKRLKDLPVEQQQTVQLELDKYLPVLIGHIDRFEELLTLWVQEGC